MHKLLVLLSVLFIACSQPSAQPVHLDAAPPPATPSAWFSNELASSPPPAKPTAIRRRLRAQMSAVAKIDLRTPDQLADVACSGPSGQWLCPARQRLLKAGGVAAVPPAWSIPDWYFDPANRTGCANDSNSCTTATCGTGGVGPCVTVNEVVFRRWGTVAPVLPQTTTLHLMSSETVGQESIVLNPIMVGAVPSNFVIDGTLGLSTVANFTLGAVTHKSRGNPGTLLQVASMPGTAAAGQLFYDSTHPSYAFIDSMASSTATVTQPLDAPSLTTPTLNPLPAEVDTWTAGDSATLYALPKINLRTFQPVGGDSFNASLAPFTWVQNVWILDASGSVGNSTLNLVPTGVGMILTNARIDPFFFMYGVNQDVEMSTLNAWLPGCGQIYYATAAAGALCTIASWGTHLYDIGGIDGDIIVHHGLYVKTVYDIIGLAYFDGSVSPQVDIIHGAIVELEPSGGLTTTNTQLWGTGAMNLESPLSAVENESGTTWASILTMGALEIDGVTTAAKYVAGSPGVFTDGVSITPANLDTFNGLQNPRTGCRFAFN